MKALKSLDKAIPKVLKALIKPFGVNIIVYKPTKLDSAYGGKGSNIEYDPEPILEGKFLIPALVKKRGTSSDALIDPFLEDSQALYTDKTVIIPNYSKVEVIIENAAPVLFKVDMPQTIKDDQFKFLRKYPLTPISDIVSHSFEDITIDEIIEIEQEIQEDIQEVRETTTERVSKQKYTYSPIE